MQRARLHKGPLRACTSPRCQEHKPARTQLSTILTSPEFTTYAKRREREWDDSKSTRASFNRYNR